MWIRQYKKKEIPCPIDSRLLEIARYEAVVAEKNAGIALKQTCVREGKALRRVLKRQCTIFGIVLCEVCCKRGGRLRTERPKDKSKLYAMYAPEVECIGKGEVRQPYEFGVKVSLAITPRRGLIVGARTFPDSPYDGHILAAQLEQTGILLKDVGRRPKQVIVDLGYRSVDADNLGVEIIRRGCFRSMTNQQRRWLKRRRAIKPTIRHLKTDHRMNWWWLAGSLDDALHAVLCATGYNLHWSIVAERIKLLFFAPQIVTLDIAARVPAAGDLTLAYVVSRRIEASIMQWSAVACMRYSGLINFEGPTK